MMDLLAQIIIVDHCGGKIMIRQEEIQRFNEITCPKCHESLMLRGSNSAWYMCGKKLFQGGDAHEQKEGE